MAIFQAQKLYSHTFPSQFETTFEAEPPSSYIKATSHNKHPHCHFHRNESVHMQTKPYFQISAVRKSRPHTIFQPLLQQHSYECNCCTQYIYINTHTAVDDAKHKAAKRQMLITRRTDPFLQIFFFASNLKHNRLHDRMKKLVQPLGGKGGKCILIFITKFCSHFFGFPLGISAILEKNTGIPRNIISQPTRKKFVDQTKIIIT